MSLHARRPLIVIFVLGAFALGAGMIYWFGGRNKISRHEPFLIYFTDTVNGLGPGSLVNFKGVPIGYVDAIRFDYRQPGEQHIPVLIQLNVDRLRRQLGVLEDMNDPAVLEAQVRRGLRAELDVDSFVTGQMFVELEYHPSAPAYTPIPNPSVRPDLPVIPSMPSGVVADLRKIQDILAWLPTFDFRTEIEKAGDKIDSVTTMVSVIPYAEYSQKIQQAVRPLARFNFNAWQRNFDNFLNRLNYAQSALNDANTNFYTQSQDFVAMSRGTRGQFAQLDAQLADFRATLHADNPSLAHVTHNLEQFSKDLDNLTRKLNAAQQQPDLLNKMAK